MTSAEALSAALDVLQRDELASYTLMIDSMGEMAVSFDVDGERFVVVANGSISLSSREDMQADAQVRTDRSTVVALIDGELQMLEAVERRCLHVLADISRMVPLARAAKAFANGAARARRVRPVLDAYRPA